MVENISAVVGIIMAFVIVVGGVGYAIHRIAGRRTTEAARGGGRGSTDREGMNGGDDEGRRGGAR